MTVLREGDLKVLFYLLGLDEEVTTTDIAKNLFKEEIKNHYDLIKKDSYIRAVLKRFEKLGIVIRSKNNNKTVYTTNSDALKVGKVFFIDWENRDTYELEAVALKLPNIGWVFVQFPPYLALKNNH